MTSRSLCVNLVRIALLFTEMVNGWRRDDMLLNSKKALKDFDSNHAYRSAQYLLRFSMIGNLALSFICLGLALAVFSLFPLKEIQPVLVGFSDKEQRVISIKTLNPWSDGLEACIEASARNFVKALETIDLNEHDMDRWRRLGDVWMGGGLKTLLGVRFNEANPDSPYAIAKSKKISRKVKILRSNLHPDSRKTVEVVWQALDYSNVTGRLLAPPTGVKNIFRSILTFEEEAGDWPVEALEENPFRLKVSNYSIHTE